MVIENRTNVKEKGKSLPSGTYTNTHSQDIIYRNNTANADTQPADNAAGGAIYNGVITTYEGTTAFTGHTSKDGGVVNNRNLLVLSDVTDFAYNTERVGLEVGAKVGLNVGSKTEVGLEYEGLFKGDYTNHTGMANLKYKF